MKEVRDMSGMCSTFSYFDVLILEYVVEGTAGFGNYLSDKL